GRFDAPGLAGWPNSPHFDGCGCTAATADTICQHPPGPRAAVAYPRSALARRRGLGLLTSSTLIRRRPMSLNMNAYYESIRARRAKLGADLADARKLRLILSIGVQI